MTKPPVLSKQSGGLVTSLLRKLRNDLFFRTEFIVIGVIFFLCFANVAIIALSLKQFHFNVASTVVSSITESVADIKTGGFDATTTSQVLLDDISEIRRANLTVVLGLSLIVTLIFGYVVARIALVPTRNALGAQKQFIGNIAHELRTPLSTLKANNEIMLMKGDSDDDSRSMLRSNIEEIDRISGIINNLLTLNTFRHADQMNFSVVNLSNIIRESVAKFETLATGKEIDLDADISPTLEIWGNKSAVVQIVTNLIKNAIVYTPREGSVAINAHQSSSERIEFEVSDTGIGIEREKLQQIFEPFYQVEPSRSQSRGSSGLGLAIVSELVKLHHGKISIQSTPHVGTVVRVELPALNPGDEKRKRVEHTPTTHNEFVMDFTKRG